MASPPVLAHSAPVGKGTQPIIVPVQWAGDSPRFSLCSGPSSYHMLSGDWDTSVLVLSLSPAAVSQPCWSHSQGSPCGPASGQCSQPRQESSSWPGFWVTGCPHNHGQDLPSGRGCGRR